MHANNKLKISFSPHFQINNVEKYNVCLEESKGHIELTI